MRNVTIELPEDLARNLELVATAHQRTLQQHAVERLRSMVESDAHELPGSPAAIIRAMQERPQVNDSDVADLEAAISVGRLPVRNVDLFTDPTRSYLPA
jgi:predicted transcriptional regulator